MRTNTRTTIATMAGRWRGIEMTEKRYIHFDGTPADYAGWVKKLGQPKTIKQMDEKRVRCVWERIDG